MKLRSALLVFSLIVIGIIITGVAIGQEGQGPEPSSPEVVTVANSFTYQGQLKSGGGGVNGQCDFQFELYDAVTGGSKIGSTLTKSSVNVVDGRFTVALNFGGSAFTGANRWLKIKVRCPAGSGSYTTLTPRQQLKATPYSLYANNAGQLDGLDSSAFSPANYVAQTVSGLAGIDTSTNETVVQTSLNLPDRCSGSTPVDQWNVLVHTNGTVWTASTNIAYALLGVSRNNATTYPSLSEVNVTTQGGSTGPDYVQAYAISYLFENVGSGNSIYRLLAHENGGGQSYNVFNAKLIVQALGYTCASSFSGSGADEDYSNSDEDQLDPKDFILLPSDS